MLKVTTDFETCHGNRMLQDVTLSLHCG